MKRGKADVLNNLTAAKMCSTAIYFFTASLLNYSNGLYILITFQNKLDLATLPLLKVNNPGENVIVDYIRCILISMVFSEVFELLHYFTIQSIVGRCGVGKWNSAFSDKFKPSCGVRQGGLPSPIRVFITSNRRVPVTAGVSRRG